jgi:hypothetical protein
MKTILILLMPCLANAAAFTVQPVVIADSTAPASYNVVGDSASSPLYTASSQVGYWTVDLATVTANKTASQLGHIHTEIYDGDENKSALVTPIRELKVTESTRLVGTAINNGTFDPNFYSSATTNGAEIWISSGIVELRSSSASTTANGDANFQTLDKARFVFSNANEFRAVIRLVADTPTIGSNERRFGLCDSTGQDGYFFSYKDGAIYVGSVKAGSATYVSTGSFSGTVPALTSNFNRFNIIYTNLGASFYVNDVLAHRLTATTSPLTGTAEFVARACNVNSGGEKDNHILQIRVIAITRLGQYLTQPTWTYLSGAGTYILKYGSGVLHRVTANTTGGPGTSVSIYDSTTVNASTIAVIDTNRTGVSNLTYELPFDTGLRVVGSGAFGNVTVVYE